MKRILMLGIISLGVYMAPYLYYVVVEDNAKPVFIFKEN